MGHRLVTHESPIVCEKVQQEGNLERAYKLLSMRRVDSTYLNLENSPAIGCFVKSIVHWTTRDALSLANIREHRMEWKEGKLTCLQKLEYW